MQQATYRTRRADSVSTIESGPQTCKLLPLLLTELAGLAAMAAILGGSLLVAASYLL